MQFLQRASDISAIAKHLGLEKYFLYAFSRGVAMAVAHVLENQCCIKGLVLHECEPTYEKPTEKWVAQFVSNKRPHIPEETVRAYWQDAVKTDLTERLSEIACPTLFIRGGMEGSLLPMERAKMLSGKMKAARIACLPNSGHEVIEQDRSLFVAMITNFFSDVESVQLTI